MGVDCEGEWWALVLYRRDHKAQCATFGVFFSSVLSSSVIRLHLIVRKIEVFGQNRFRETTFQIECAPGKILIVGALIFEIATVQDLALVIGILENLLVNICARSLFRACTIEHCQFE